MHFFVGLPIPEGEEAIGIIASELYGAEEDEELMDLTDLDETELAEVISGEDEGEAEASDISSIDEINSVSEEALNDLAEAQEEE